MNIVICGRRGQGKTTLALSLSLRLERPVIVFDPNAQIVSYPFVSVEDIDTWLRDGAQGIRVFRPDPSRLGAEFATLCECLEPWGHYVLSIDEAKCLHSAHVVHPSLNRLVRQAPREDQKNTSNQPLGVIVIQATHRLIDINADCRSLITDFFCFYTTSPLDLEAVENTFGKTARDVVVSLGAYECLHAWFTPGGKEAAVDKWMNPRTWWTRL